MKVVVVEPKKKPVVQDINSGLESMQKMVGGSIGRSIHLTSLWP